MRAYRCSVGGFLAANVIACAFGLTAYPTASAQEAPPASQAEPSQAKPSQAKPSSAKPSPAKPSAAPSDQAAPDASKAPVAEPAQPPAAPSKTPPAVTDTKAQEKIKKAETPAKAEKKEEHEPADPDTGTSTLSPETLGLLPNPYERQGIKFTLSYVADALANVDGGLKRGAVYDGRLNGAIDLDLAKLAGAPGLVFHANAFQIHGPGLSRDYIGNLMPVSSIEALATTRLYEAWFEQKFWNDKFSIRAGQLAADAEFITSRYTDPFMGGTFGWPAITAIDLPSGGPSPPLAAMGARVKAIINDNFTFLAAVFDGNAAGPGIDDPQSRDRYGVNFRVNDPPFVISEMQYAYNQEKTSKGLPGTLKLGGWYHAGPFDDQRFASNGLSQADPNAAATPAQLTSNYGVYTVFEQKLVSFAGRESERGIGVFTRVLGSPGDRNLINFYADGGVVATGPLASRENDKIGLAVAYARISDSARALDRDYQILANDPRPIRDYELLVTASYLAEIRKGWTVLPTLQYIVHPGGGYVMDNGAAKPVRNATVIGVRTVLKF
jgi:porin